MKEYDIEVSFEKGTIFCPNIELVQGDIKSAIFNFKFDIDKPEYVKVFQMKYEGDDEYNWIKEIVDNKIILFEEKEDTKQLISVINKSGSYVFDVVLYNGEDKITTTETNSFYVREAIIDENYDDFDDNTKSIIDDLINKNVQIENRLKKLEELGYIIIE